MRSLPIGTQVRHLGVDGKVCVDYGGSTLEVEVAGARQQWARGPLQVIAFPKGLPFYDDFSTYTLHFEDGERYRSWLTHGGKRNVMLIRQAEGEPNGLPGNYLAVFKWDGTWQGTGHRILINDCDDGCVVRTFEPGDRDEYLATLAALQTLAPLSRSDAIDVLGFRRD